MPFKMNFRAPMQRMASRMPAQGGLGVAMMPRQGAMAAPGGSSGFDERTGTYTRPPQVFDRLFGRPRIDFETGQPLPPGGGMGFGQAMGAGQGLGGILGALRGMSEQPMRITSMQNVNRPAAPSTQPIAMDEGFNPVTWMNQPYTPVSPQPAETKLRDTYVRPAPVMAIPLPEPVMPISVPQMGGTVSSAGSPMPSFDPNRALNDYNARIGDIYAGGGQMDMNMIREQQAALRNLQLNRNATAEQHDAAYRSALAALRAKYPDAFPA